MKTLSTLILCAAAFAALTAPASAAQIIRTPNTSGDEYCREFTQTIGVGGRIQSGYGTACLQPDGDWQIQSFTTGNGTYQQPQQVVSQEQYYDQPDPVNYVIIDEEPVYVTPSPSFSFSYDSGGWRGGHGRHGGWRGERWGYDYGHHGGHGRWHDRGW